MSEKPGQNHYFNYRARHAADELKQTLARGIVSLAIGLAFLFACLWLRNILGNLPQESGKEIFAEGLLIMGWVAMWRPIEIFLYDWWPIQHRQRIFRYIGAMPIQIRGKHRSEDGVPKSVTAIESQ